MRDQETTLEIEMVLGYECQRNLLISSVLSKCNVSIIPSFTKQTTHPSATMLISKRPQQPSIILIQGRNSRDVAPSVL